MNAYRSPPRRTVNECVSNFSVSKDPPFGSIFSRPT